MIKIVVTWVCESLFMKKTALQKSNREVNCSQDHDLGPRLVLCPSNDLFGKDTRGNKAKEER